MNFRDMELSIYESYQNGEITKNAACDMLETINEKYVDSIISEAASAENEFIESSMSVVNKESDFYVMTEAASTFIDKIKAAWRKFAEWIKSIINRIFNKKPNIKNDKKYKLPKGFREKFSQLKTAVHNLISGSSSGYAQAIAIVSSLSFISYIKHERELSDDVRFDYVGGDTLGKILKDSEQMSRDMQKHAEKQSESNDPNKESSKCIDALRKAIGFVQDIVKFILRCVAGGAMDATYGALSLIAGEDPRKAHAVVHGYKDQSDDLNILKYRANT
jgi:hypothetical protein